MIGLVDFFKNNVDDNPLPYYLSCLLQLVQLWLLEALSRCSFVPLTYLNLFFFFLIISLLSGTRRSSRLSLYILCPSPRDGETISPRSPCPFYERIISEPRSDPQALLIFFFVLKLKIAALWERCLSWSFIQ